MATMANTRQEIPTDDELVAAARSLHREAVERLMQFYFPRVARVAASLCARTSVGRSVVRGVMRRSIQFIPKWEAGIDAHKWFLHHTILASRTFADKPPSLLRDSLLEPIENPPPEYTAFIRAFRTLPPQQREAFVLSRAERLDIRLISLSMDCSTAAATNHLQAATNSLSALAAAQFDANFDLFLRAYRALTPAEQLILGDVTLAGKAVTRQRIRRRIIQLLEVIVLALIVWTIWRLSRMIEI